MPMESDNGQPDSESSLLAFFGKQLRKQREKHGWSQEETARRALTTGAMISYLENAKRVPSAELAVELDRVFGTDFFSEFYPLVIRYAYPSWFLPYVAMERDATSIRMFDSQVVSGLLQTEAYARALLASGRPDHVDGLVAARLTRQEAVFEREDPTWIRVSTPTAAACSRAAATVPGCMSRWVWESATATRSGSGGGGAACLSSRDGLAEGEGMALILGTRPRGIPGSPRALRRCPSARRAGGAGSAAPTSGGCRAPRGRPGRPAPRGARSAAR